MGENEVKPKHGLPCGVRLTEGLGGAGGATALAPPAETLGKPERRDTLCIGTVFTSGSVPELTPIQHHFDLTNWRGAFSPVSGPPKDGQPPQDLRLCTYPCQ